MLNFQKINAENHRKPGKPQKIPQHPREKSWKIRKSQEPLLRATTVEAMQSYWLHEATSPGATPTLSGAGAAGGAARRTVAKAVQLRKVQLPVETERWEDGARWVLVRVCWETLRWCTGVPKERQGRNLVWLMRRMFLFFVFFKYNFSIFLLKHPFVNCGCACYKKSHNLYID